MQSYELITIGIVILFSFALFYKSSFLQSKKIGYISISQIFLLVLIPGILYTIIFYYILDVLERPQNGNVFLNDKILTSILLLSLLYTYGGIAIHFVCKTLRTYFNEKLHQTMLFKVNHFFHFKFSHNLTYIGAATSATCLSLLELNHTSPYPKDSKILITLLSGVFLGLAAIISLKIYTMRMELKAFFLSGWVLFVILIYAAKPYIKKC